MIAGIIFVIWDKGEHDHKKWNDYTEMKEAITITMQMILLLADKSHPS